MKNEIQRVDLEGDKETIDQLHEYLVLNFPRLDFKKKVLLRNLFPEPNSRWLKTFWNYGSHADIATFRHGELICIVEPGGAHHFKDEQQKVRDEKKDKLCRVNGISCLRLSNSMLNYLAIKQTRRLLKKYFYGGQNAKTN